AICGGHRNQWSPSWSSDGGRLELSSDHGGRPELCIHEFEDGRCRSTGAEVIRASTVTGYQPAGSPHGPSVNVPRRTEPAPEMSDAVDPMAFAAADEDGDGSAPPRIFYSASEAADRELAADSVDMEAFVMASYNATLAAVDAGTGEVRTLVDARTEPRP